MSHQLFVSYAHEDAEFVERLAGDLAASDIPLWLDRWEIEAGQVWDRAVQSALENCAHLLVILSPNSVASENVLDEVDYALKRDREVFPALYRECDLPMRLGRLQYADFTASYEPALRELTQRLQQAALSVTPVPGVARRRNPFVWGGAVTVGRAIATEARRHLAAGADPDALWKGLERGAHEVDRELDSIAKRVDLDALQSVAKTASGDLDIGLLSAEACDRVGTGVIFVEQRAADHIEADLNVLEILPDGNRLNDGYLSRRFITDPERSEAVVEDPRLLICEDTIAEARDLEPILRALTESGTNGLVVLAQSIEPPALSVLIRSMSEGRLGTLGIAVTGPVDHRKEVLEDIAILTGAQLISVELGRTPLDATLEDLGSAERIVCTQGATTVFGGGGDPAQIDNRAALVRRQSSMTRSREDGIRLRRRLALLDRGSAVIYAGGRTPAERSRNRRLIETAVTAAIESMQEGFVPGGGIALLRARSALQKLESENSDQAKGALSLRAALESPLREIAAQAGQDPETVLDTVDRVASEKQNADIGYDPRHDSYVDVVEAGILEPAIRVRRAVELAVVLARQTVSPQA